jgi:DNA-binding NarL/FixJ family response regulator
MTSASAPKPIEAILIVEDEWITARDLQQTLTEWGYRVTGLANSADAALASIANDPPDLALVDIRIEGAVDGIDLARIIGERWQIPVVYLTAHSDRETVDRLKATGPLGYVAKPFDEGQLRVAVELALHTATGARERQERARTAEMRSAILEDRLRQISAIVSGTPGAAAPLPASLEDGLSKLTRRELELIQMLVRNRRVPTIARELSLSVHTVRNHLRAVFKKLGVHSQEELLDLVGELPPDTLTRRTP